MSQTRKISTTAAPPGAYIGLCQFLHPLPARRRYYCKARRTRAVPRRDAAFIFHSRNNSYDRLLQTVDNPRRDVALAAALSSPMFGFTADDLARIRAAKRGCDFYSALLERAENDEKCRYFAAFLAKTRSLAPDISVRRLINRVSEALDLPAVGPARPETSCCWRPRRAVQSGGYRGCPAF